MKTKILAWVILAGLAVGLFYATQFALDTLRNWAYDTTDSLKTSQAQRMELTEQHLMYEEQTK